MPDAELPDLFLSCTRRLEVICGELAINSDQPLEKLRGQVRALVRQHHALLDAADALCTCAHPTPQGWYVLPRELTRLQAAVDAASG